MFRVRYVLLLGLSLAAWALPAPAQAVVYGAAVEGDFANYERGAWTWDQVQTSLSRLRAAGASVTRAGAKWARTEPKPPVGGRHRYDWSYDDMVAEALAGAHLRWDPTLDYTPKWAQQHIRPAVYHNKRGAASFVSPIPPANDDVYAAYVAAFARRYGVHGSFWRTHKRLVQEPVETFEIWNEPDCRWTWGPKVDLQAYARLYSAAYRAIKRVDRRSTVITAGLAFTRSSLPRLLRAFTGLPMDGLGVHPYGADARSTIALVLWTEAQMVAYGRGRTPLIVNEFGWNSLATSWQSVAQRYLHRNVVRSIVGLSEIRHVTAVIPFEWTDAAWGLSDRGFARAVKLARDRTG